MPTIEQLEKIDWTKFTQGEWGVVFREQKPTNVLLLNCYHPTRVTRAVAALIDGAVEWHIHGGATETMRVILVQVSRCNTFIKEQIALQEATDPGEGFEFCSRDECRLNGGEYRKLLDGEWSKWSRWRYLDPALTWQFRRPKAQPKPEPKLPTVKLPDGHTWKIVNGYVGLLDDDHVFWLLPVEQKARDKYRALADAYDELHGVETVRVDDAFFRTMNKTLDSDRGREICQVTLDFVCPVGGTHELELWFRSHGPLTVNITRKPRT